MREMLARVDRKYINQYTAKPATLLRLTGEDFTTVFCTSQANLFNPGIFKTRNEEYNN